MILEVRRYEIEPGRRAEFVQFFDDEVLPAMQAAGMTVIGQFESAENDTTFIYIRSFAGAEERDRQTQQFYNSDVWLTRLRDRALEMETSWHVDVVRPTAGSLLR